MLTIQFTYERWIKGLKTAENKIGKEKGEYRNILSGLSRDLEGQNLSYPSQKGLINIQAGGNSSK